VRGHTARKRFGQNFLADAHYVAKIVDAIDPRAGDNLVEIGPGLAALTGALVERAGRIHAIEIDRDLAGRLAAEFPPDRLTLHVADALEFDYAVLGPRLRVVGNLPYNISTPLLFRLAAYGTALAEYHRAIELSPKLRRLAAAWLAKPSAFVFASHPGDWGIAVGLNGLELFEHKQERELPANAMTAVNRFPGMIVNGIAGRTLANVEPQFDGAFAGATANDVVLIRNFQARPNGTSVAYGKRSNSGCSASATPGSSRANAATRYGSSTFVTWTAASLSSGCFENGSTAGTVSALAPAPRMKRLPQCIGR